MSRIQGDHVKKTAPLGISLWELCQNPIILERENFKMLARNMLLSPGGVGRVSCTLTYFWNSVPYGLFHNPANHSVSLILSLISAIQSKDLPVNFAFTGAELQRRGAKQRGFLAFCFSGNNISLLHVWSSIQVTLDLAKEDVKFFQAERWGILLRFFFWDFDHNVSNFFNMLLWCCSAFYLLDVHMQEQDLVGNCLTP